jgi:hypothetical protein
LSVSSCYWRLRKVSSGCAKLCCSDVVGGTDISGLGSSDLGEWLGSIGKVRGETDNINLHVLRFIEHQMMERWARKFHRYSDWLRAERFRDRIPLGARFTAPVQTGPGTHPAFCTRGTGSFPKVESGRGVTLTPHPILVPRSKNRVALYLYSP